MSSSVLCKICLIGAPAVGKTSLVQRVARGVFPPEPATQGIAVTEIALPVSGAKISLWDIAGRCALDSLNQAFLSRVDVLLAVASPDVPESERIAHDLLAQAQSLHPRARAALLVNKIDLGQGALPEARPGLPVFAVSARDGCGIEQVLTAALEAGIA